MSSTIPLKMQVEIERLRLRSPFRISGYTFNEVPVAAVTLRSEQACGRAEAAGVYYYYVDLDGPVFLAEDRRVSPVLTIEQRC